MTQSIYYDHIPNSPLGQIWIAVSDTGLWTIDWQISQEDFFAQIRKRGASIITKNIEMTELAKFQLTEYLNGQRKFFSLTIDQTGWSEFTKITRAEVSNIPYGTTQTYRQVANQVGKPNASRAVGRANATNPIPLVIPCHRVVGSDGQLKGYGGGGGLETKQWLLDFEKINVD